MVFIGLELNFESVSGHFRFNFAVASRLLLDSKGLLSFARLAQPAEYLVWVVDPTRNSCLRVARASCASVAAENETREVCKLT